MPFFGLWRDISVVMAPASSYTVQAKPQHMRPEHDVAPGILHRLAVLVVSTGIAGQPSLEAMLQQAETPTCVPSSWKAALQA